ncbi:MAG: phage Gp37/Gp68 family protein [Puniceicoccales bacterium]|nr:phage Gp37/Gp68 family protein [Puniceicoccales bacterium]
MSVFWNPWHGCRKMSEGCRNCYVYFFDRRYGRNTSIVTRSKTGFSLPVAKNRAGIYKIPPGTTITTCINSDFFIEDADLWRQETWAMMKERSDCVFFIITKRAARFTQTLPGDWGEGYENLQINVTAENQQAADQRLPIFLETPMRYRGIIVSPVLEAVNLRRFLATGKVDKVTVSGESYAGARVTRFDDILAIRRQCVDYNVSFFFHQTGRFLLKDGQLLRIPRASERTLAAQFGLDFVAKL